MTRKLARVLAPPRSTTYADHVNARIKWHRGHWFVNERLVEATYVHKFVSIDGQGKRALDLGWTRSDLALQLAAFGYEVVALDLRDYEFTHPMATFHKQNLLDYEDAVGFDYITAVSVVEHIGLGAYQERESSSDRKRVTERLPGLLKQGGRLIVTVPFGRPHQDGFLRSFSRAEIGDLFSGPKLTLEDESYFRRESLRFWHPCEQSVAAAISNEANNRGPTGVNCVGCFVWRRSSEP